MSKSLSKTSELNNNGSSVTAEDEIQYAEIQNEIQYSEIQNETTNDEQTTGPQVVISRKFRLHDIDIPASMFDQYKKIVNDQIKQGLKLPTHLFEKDSLVAVKRFYKELDNCKCGLKERLHRCAAQYSYFSLREYRNNQNNQLKIVEVLRRNGIFSDNYSQIHKETGLSYYEITNKQNFLANKLIEQFSVDSYFRKFFSDFFSDQSELIKYNAQISKIISDKNKLDKIFKTFTNRVVRCLNKRFKQLQSLNSSELTDMINESKLSKYAKLSKFSKSVESTKLQELPENSKKSKIINTPLIVKKAQKAQKAEKAKIAKMSNYDTTIFKMLNIDIDKLKGKVDLSTISQKEWKTSKDKWKDDLRTLLPELKVNNKFYVDLPDWSNKINTVQPTKMIVDLFKSHSFGRNKNKNNNQPDNLWVNGALFQDFLNFLQLHLDFILKNQLVDYLIANSLDQINHLLSTFEQDLKKEMPTLLKVPEFKKPSIPVGIDDGSVYQLEELMEDDIITEVRLKVSLVANNYSFTSLKDIERYTQLTDQGFKSQRGVLNFSRGKFFMYIPFTKKVTEERDKQVIAAVDLGLKTLATISVYDLNNLNKVDHRDIKQKKNHDELIKLNELHRLLEIDRQFLDQSQLQGKKTEWFKQSSKTPVLNLKSKLMDRRLVARTQQSKKALSKKGTMKFWLARKMEKAQWRKIGNLHKELIRQISTRIVAYLNYHNVGVLVLENLKWSQHSSKTQSGYFINTWQIHWFFSQVQRMLTNMAKINGIKVELVDPKHTSKICHVCRGRGRRAGKTFYCLKNKCKVSQVDSDLNAARNLVQRSKAYKKYMKNKNKLSDAIG
jgi:IS605 OrfB family transposase